MDFTMRSLLLAEQKYTYAQSQQIRAQAGSIGHLRGDFDTGGRGFYTTWEDHHPRLKTDEFKAELDGIVNSLRQEGGVLCDRETMRRYGYDHGDSAFPGNYCTEYGFRMDAGDHAFLLRCNPQKGDYNFYCFCYVREWLDGHIREAERGIRFITPDYKEKFRIPDGDSVQITWADGEKDVRVCRYIDDTHLELGNNLYHICQLAERLEQSGGEVIPLRSSLPEQCYGLQQNTGEIIILKRGETGYYKTDIPGADREENRTLVNEYNEKLGVSKAQAEAMKAGSLFGWAVPAADPKSYSEEGLPVKPKSRNRGEAR